MATKLGGLARWQATAEARDPGECPHGWQRFALFRWISVERRRDVEKWLGKDRRGVTPCGRHRRSRVDSSPRGQGDQAP